ncbi:heavy metal translocatin, partial [Hortaea werneckii]
MTTCCKREDSETIPTCRSNESDARDGAENEMKCATSDINTEERCSGEMCDEKCIQAAAAVECRAACDQELNQTSECRDVDHTRHHEAEPLDMSHKHVQREVSAHQHSHDKDNSHQWDACSSHLRAAFERYTRFLEQTLCICKKVQAEHFLSGRCDAKPVDQPHRHSDSLSGDTSSSSAVERMPHGQVVFRQATTKKPECCGKSTMQSAASIPAGKCSTGEQECSGQKQPAYSGCSGPDHSRSRRQGFFSRNPKEAPPADIEKQPSNFEPVTFAVTGMDCSGCGNIVAKAFDNVPGVQNTCVTFIAGTASCDINLNVTSISEVVRLVERATKYKLARSDSTHPSMDLIMDMQTAQSLSRNMPKGVIGYDAVSSREHRITYDSSIIGARKVLEMIPGASLAPPSQDESLTAGQARLRNVFWTTVAAFCLTIPVVVLSWANPPVSEHTILYVSIVLATLVQIIAVPEFYRPALSALLYNRVVEMDMLVVLSISAAYGYSIVAFGLVLAGKGAESTEPLFETSTLLISLILLGRLVAAYARKRAVAAVSLRSLQSATASLVGESGNSFELDARLLELGDVILIGPHTQIVTDGTVSAGNSDVDESMITGEAIPISKFPGDAVIAGTVNKGGTLTVTINRLPGKNTVTDIANLVEQAQSTKPRVQDLADKVAGYFIPVVLSISIMVTVIWVVVELKVRNQSAGPAVGNAITYGIAVLAVSCPCALGLAVPMVLVIASGVAARLGIIIKTADVVERGFRCTDVIFDKTGTLTESTLDVV